MQLPPLFRPISTEPNNAVATPLVGVAQNHMPEVQGAEEQQLIKMPPLVLEKINSGLDLKDWKSFSLLNKHIRSIAMERFAKANIKGCDLEIVKSPEVFTRLTHVILHEPVTPKTIDNLIRKAPFLETLQIVGRDRVFNGAPNMVRDDTLEAISGLAHLRSLDLSKCDGVTDRGLKALCKIKNLTMLDLSAVQFSDYGFEEFPKLSKLTTLSLATKMITDESLTALTKISNLATLNLYGCGITDKGVETLATFAGLTEINLSENKISVEGLKVLAKRANLTKLNVSFNQITDEELKSLSTFTQITALKLTQGQQITDEGLKALATLTQLTTLELRLSKITDEGLKTLAMLDNLATLKLSCCSITDQGLKMLSKLSKLTTLHLSNIKQMTEEGLKTLAEFPNLATLELAFNKQITDESLVALYGMSQLKYLDVTHCKVTNEGSQRLKNKFPALTVMFDYAQYLEASFCKRI